MTLLTFLREVLGLTGSKLGCAEGGCGACTVMISKSADDHFSANACLMPVLAADMCHVTTVEGVGSLGGKENNKLHPIQERMVELHGSQCGYCTPGIIVAIYALFASGNNSIEKVEEHLDGNLCRCTGYRPIWDSVKSLCSDDIEDIKGPCGESCKTCPERHDCTNPCNNTKSKGEIQSNSTQDKINSMSKMTAELHAQPSEMFPGELKLLMEKEKTHQKDSASMAIITSTSSWYKPTTIDQMVSLLNKYPDAKIVVGNTEVGIETKFKHAYFPRYISASSVPSLTSIESTSDNIIIGACTPLSKIQHFCENVVEQEQSSGTGAGVRVEYAIMHMLRWFASTQIRNVASLSGNLVTGSPISDMNPMLAALGAHVELISSSSSDGETIKKRTIAVKDFFLSYRKVDLNPGEFVSSIVVPRIQNKTYEYVLPFKQARRREDDISIVTSGMRVKLDESTLTITEAAFSFGGMAPKTVMASKTAEFIVGKQWSRETFDEARKVLAEELKLPNIVPGGQAEYRRTLASSFLHKFYLATALQIQKDLLELNGGSTPLALSSLVEQIQTDEISGADSFVTSKKPSIVGTQTHPAPQITQGIEDKTEQSFPQKIPEAKEASGETGKAVTHASGPLHCTGEAVYTDDIPPPDGMLHSSLILSDRPTGKIISFEKGKALEMEGVIGVYTYEDLKQLGGSNELGPILHDEEVFAESEVRHVGMVLGIVVAESIELAHKAARAVQVIYDENYNLKPIITIKDAIEANSFFDSFRHTLESTNSVDEELSKDDIVIVEGEFSVGGQEHFYLECNSTLAIPQEGNRGLEIFTSSQAAHKTQVFCASATNTPMNQVVVRIKRMGGGFGGKETRSVFAASAAAVAAKLSRRPVKITLDRHIDMSTTGGRHSFLAKYRASVNKKDGTLGALDVQLFNNGGASLDLSAPVMDRALFHVDGVYKWKAFRAIGVPCKTNQPPHTAFRGFGGPQGIAIVETILDHLAFSSNIPVDTLRRNNMYKEGEYTPFGVEIAPKTWNVPTAWDKLAVSAKYHDRKKDVDRFNSQHKYKKRGIALLPTKFGIAFTSKFMNQGGALVHLYTDGTILVSHGGTEMGQGLHTKVCQIAAQAFGVSLSRVFIQESATDKVANAQPTAASMSTDLYGMATLDACRQILKRIQPYIEKFGRKLNDETIAKIAFAAHFDRIDLSAHGFFIVPGGRCGYDWNREKPSDYQGPDNAYRGHAFNYFTQGVACSEVEIDTLTGDFRTIRTDVMVDVGSSINPAIDIGQIEGAFIQGMGWCTTEEMVWGNESDHVWINPKGRLHTQGPGTYKIPGFNDTPEQFNVELMSDVHNPFAVHSSKAIGEPPFFLGCSVYFAIKEAVKASRESSEELSSQGELFFKMNMPATSEKIRMLCGDPIAADGILANYEKDENLSEEQKRQKVVEFQPNGCY